MLAGDGPSSSTPRRDVAADVRARGGGGGLKVCFVVYRHLREEGDWRDTALSRGRRSCVKLSEINPRSRRRPAHVLVDVDFMPNAVRRPKKKPPRAATCSTVISLAARAISARVRAGTRELILRWAPCRQRCSTRFDRESGANKASTSTQRRGPRSLAQRNGSASRNKRRKIVCRLSVAPGGT